MSAEFNQELYTYLSTDAGIVAQVGTKIYPLRAPNTAAMPYIVFQTIDDIGRHHHRGASGMPTASVQIDVWGPNSPQETVNNAAEAVRLAMDGFQGEMGDLDVRSALLEDQRSIAVDASDGSENFKWGIQHDYSITYRRNATNFF
jgi:hypothetical protein